MVESPSPQSSVQRHAGVLVAQCVLLALTVLASTMLPGSRMTTGAIMALAALNGAVVMFGAMGARRDGWMVSALLAMTAFLIIGLLVWPAWDVAERSRVF